MFILVDNIMITHTTPEKFSYRDYVHKKRSNRYFLISLSTYLSHR